MTSINGVAYGPIIKLNDQIGIKVSEDGHASLKALTDTDNLFLRKNIFQHPQMGVTFNFIEDGTEIPLEQTADLKITWQGNVTITSMAGKTELKRDVESPDYQVKMPKGNITVHKQDLEHDGLPDLQISTPQGKVTVMAREVHAGKFGTSMLAYHIQTPQGEYRATTDQYQHEEGYQIVSPPGSDFSVIRLEKVANGHYRVESSPPVTGRQFDLAADSRGNWHVTTPGGQTVDIIKSKGTYTVKSPEGISQVRSSGSGRYQIIR